MKRNNVSITERRGTRLKQNQTSSQWKVTPSNPKVMRKKISVNMVNTRSKKEHKAKEKQMEGPTVSARETDLGHQIRVLTGWIERRWNQHQCQMQKNRRRKQ